MQHMPFCLRTLPSDACWKRESRSTENGMTHGGNHSTNSIISTGTEPSLDFQKAVNPFPLSWGVVVLSYLFQSRAKAL
jgi:hypothetical protein